MSVESIFDPCPYCQSKDNCEHLLLVVDATFRTAEGGLLMDSFKKRWHAFFDGDEDIDERIVFDQLIDEVDAFATAAAVANQDSMPGFSSSYQIFYAESKEKANGALSLFRKGKSPLAHDAPPSLLAKAIGGTDDLPALRKIDEQLLFDSEIQQLEETPQHCLTGELELAVDEFIGQLPKPRSYASAIGRKMKTLNLRGNVKRFIIIQNRIPKQEEVKKLWDAS